MCSFFGIITEKKDIINYIESERNNLFKKLKYRGPDVSSIKRPDDKALFAGFVLAINDFVEQPVEKNGSWLMWNGEIYKYPKEYSSDTRYLLDYFTNDGVNRIFDPNQALDGEYAITFYENDRLYLITDDFFTKPLSFSVSDDTIIFSSYESAIKEVSEDAVIQHALPNSMYIFDTKNYSLIERKEIYEWDFEPRYDSYENWIKAYTEAVAKRCDTDKKIFLPLSSGYDSGAICSEVLHLNKKCKMFTYKGVENQAVLAKRRKLIVRSGNVHQFINPKKNFEEYFELFYRKVENWIGYRPEHLGGKPYIDVYHAYSCFAHFVICDTAKKRGYKICLSGHGADEIYSDYYTPATSGSSVVKGDYSGWRRKWPNFDMGYGRNILGMFDRTAGACGIETRYPYLDRQSVQNFLWLSDELKNAHYKQCLHQVMKKRDFPFDEKNLKVPLRIFEGDHMNKMYKMFREKFYAKNKIVKPSWINR